MSIGNKRWLIFLVILYFLSSCTVTNNFYVNSAIPAKKGDPDVYVGISNGYKPKPDSGEFSRSYIIAGGAQIAITKSEKTNVRAAVHVCELFTGIGARAGIQQSFFKRSSDFNIALGVDFGFATSKDSTKNIFNDSMHAVSNKINNTLNMDFFVPISFRLSENSQLTITPRYSYTKVRIRNNVSGPNQKSHNVYFPALSVGYRYKYLYFESSILQLQNKLVPFFGVGFITSGSQKVFK